MKIHEKWYLPEEKSSLYVIRTSSNLSNSYATSQIPKTVPDFGEGQRGQLSSGHKFGQLGHTKNVRCATAIKAHLKLYVSFYIDISGTFVAIWYFWI